MDGESKGPGAGKKKTKSYVRDICYIGVFCAVLVVCSYIALPLGEISFTLQTMAVCLCAALLGWKRGAICVLCYILLGVCGVPVFSGFKNFYALIASASAGYVVGFVFTAIIVGAAADAFRGRWAGKRTAFRAVAMISAMVLGVAVCYFFGTAWFMFIYKGTASGENLQLALTLCVYPFILPDILKIALSYLLYERLKRRISI